MALGSRALAKTTARMGCALMGTARMGFRPRNTTTHVPGPPAGLIVIPEPFDPTVARYYVWGRVAMPTTAPTVVLS